MANKSANQCYKESNSQLPFREWLRIEQDNGRLENHETMLNASGEIEAVEVAPIVIKKKASGMNTSSILGLVSLGVFAYGIYNESKR